MRYNLRLGLKIYFALEKSNWDFRGLIFFYKRTKEEGKTGRELAAARLSNKIKYGKEGAMIGGGFPLIGVAFRGFVKTLRYERDV